MRSKDKKRFLAIAVFVLILMALVILMLVRVSRMQGNARVVNYAGIVRGATQRLVKEELFGSPNDAAIARLDSILDGLQNGGGEHKLIRLEDEAYQSKLGQLTKQWAALKETIYAAREDTALRDTLFEASETYFVLADETVTAAEEYSDGIAAQLRTLEFLIILIILIVALLFLISAVDEFRMNRRLKRIAYIDANTGLPNQRSCEERLNAGGLPAADAVLCCLMFDLNNLKLVNDTLGHKAGDLLISGFANVLRRTAPANMFVGRLGGDEFIGIIEHTSAKEIEAFLDMLRHAVANLNSEQNQNGIRISYASGYALSSEHPGCTAKVLMDLADHNMYLNKQEIKRTTGIGRDC